MALGGSLPNLQVEKNNPREDRTVQVRLLLLESCVAGTFAKDPPAVRATRFRSRALYVFDLEIICIDTGIVAGSALKDLGPRAYTRTVRTCSFEEAPREAIAQVDAQRRRVVATSSLAR